MHSSVLYQNYPNVYRKSKVSSMKEVDTQTTMAELKSVVSTLLYERAKDNELLSHYAKTLGDLEASTVTM